MTRWGVSVTRWGVSVTRVGVMRLHQRVDAARTPHLLEGATSSFRVFEWQGVAGVRALPLANALRGLTHNCRRQRRPPLYGGSTSPVRGFDFPCTGVRLPLYGGSTSPVRGFDFPCTSFRVFELTSFRVGGAALWPAALNTEVFETRRHGGLLGSALAHNPKTLCVSCLPSLRVLACGNQPSTRPESAPYPQE